jgi:alpha-glucuronidase
MKRNHDAMLKLRRSLLTCFLLSLAVVAASAQPRNTTAKVALHLDRRIPQLAFAAQEIQRALADQSVNVVARNLADAAPDQTVIVLAAGAQAQAAVAQWQVAPLKSNDAQSYAIRVRAAGKQRIYVILGADAVGAMYGGLEIAEAS